MMKGKPTGAQPRTIDGVTFRCHRVGITSYAWFAEGDTLVVSSTWNKAAYTAHVDGVPIVSSTGKGARKYRSLRNAMRAAVQFAAAKE